MSLVLGVDIGGTAVKIGLVDEGGTVLCSETRSVDFDGYKTPIIETTTALAKEQLARAPERPIGVGVSATGQIDSAAGRVVGVGTNLGDWLGCDIRGALGAALGLPVAVLNDANAAALGEQRYGGARGCANVLVLTIGTGVGGGIIENGRLIQGRRGIGGEIGHMSVYADGVRCGCGNRGCFERYGSTGALVRRFRENASLLERLGVPAEQVDGRVIFGRLADAEVQAAVDGWISDIASGTVSLIHIFNPERVLFGGGISRETEHFIEPLRRAILTRAMPRFAEGLTVDAAALGNSAGLMGAAAFFRDTLH